MEDRSLNKYESNTYTLIKSKKGILKDMPTKPNIHFHNPNTNEDTQRYIARILVMACVIKLEKEMEAITSANRTECNQEENPVA